MATYTEHSRLFEGVPGLERSPFIPSPFKDPLGASSLPGFPQGSGNLNVHCPYPVALCFGAWETAVDTLERNNVFHIHARVGGMGEGSLGRPLTHCSPNSKDSEALTWREDGGKGQYFAVPS